MKIKVEIYQIFAKLEKMERITKLCNEYANQNSKIEINYNTFSKIFELSKNKNDNKKEMTNEGEMKQNDYSEDLDVERDVISGEERNDLFRKTRSNKNVEQGATLTSRKNILIGNKRKRKNSFLNNGPTRMSKKRKVFNNKTEQIENEMKHEFKKNESTSVEESKIGFKDDDFHIINESDEKWIFYKSGRVEKNEILTELVLSEKEIKMVSVIKQYFEN